MAVTSDFGAVKACAGSGSGRVILLCLALASLRLDGTLASEKIQARVAPDLAIVTEVSSTRPFAGQQVSVIYSLRATVAPSAIDIDPQQFSGFWTEAIPLPEDGRTRWQGAAKAEEYLLRQIVAYPLFAGSVELPPLRVKIKRSGSSTASGDWDIVGLSAPVSLVIQQPPAPAANPGTEPLVGTLSGAFSRERVGTLEHFVLELKGTANLALFEPAAWIPEPQRKSYSIRAADWENAVQTVDVKGDRRISLIQRRRWTLRCAGGAPASVPDLNIPVFQPESRVFSNVQIRGIAGSSDSRPPVASALAADEPVPEAGHWKAWIAFAALFVATAVAALVLRKSKNSLSGR